MATTGTMPTISLTSHGLRW